ncbi:MAG TPA: outer membrane beta-barrel protein, partial [Gemmatimonadaceae bacterium]
MNRQRLFVAGLGFAVALPAALLAQGTGSVELGGFGQFTRADGAWRVSNGFGLGGRVGFHFMPRLALEADASFSTFDNKAPRPDGSTEQSTFAGRIMYSIPFGMGGRMHQFMMGAGAGGQRFGGHNDFSFSPDVGLRFTLPGAIALRFDGVLEYVENPTAATFGFPPVIGVN